MPALSAASRGVEQASNQAVRSLKSVGLAGQARVSWQPVRFEALWAVRFRSLFMGTADACEDGSEFINEGSCQPASPLCSRARGARGEVNQGSMVV